MDLTCCAFCLRSAQVGIGQTRHAVDPLAIDELRFKLQLETFGGKIYLDIGDPEWQAVEIDASGWRMIQDPPVRFRRTAGMAALPLPERGGSIAQLRSLVNLTDDGFVLYVSCILDALCPGRPHPVLYLAGEEGSTKSTAAKIARSLIDPNTVPLRNLPTNVRELFVSAHGSYALAFDNVSDHLGGDFGRTLSDCIRLRLRHTEIVHRHGADADQRTPPDHHQRPTERDQPFRSRRPGRDHTHVADCPGTAVFGSGTMGPVRTAAFADFRGIARLYGLWLAAVTACSTAAAATNGRLRIMVGCN